MPKALIIEDESAYQKILKETFEKEGFDIVLASDGQNAFDEIVKSGPDLILLDIMLPGNINGFDILEQLKADGRTENIPVIVITNLATEEKVAKEIGASCYFIKAETTISQIVDKAKDLLSKN